MSFDLTLGNYRSLCAAIKERQSDCRFIAYLKSKDKNGNVILRHDVDRKPKRALRMAKIESELGIRSSYYFRSTKGSFRPEIMKEIEVMGHEVGYHYEVLIKTEGNVEEALKLFEKEVSSFRKVVKIETVCSHGSPQSKFDNRQIWVNSSFDKFDVIGETSLSVQDVDYFTDTGGSWESEANIRDNVANNKSHKIVKSTAELKDFVTGSLGITIYINCHPERWTDKALESVSQSIKDKIINMAKVLIKMNRKTTDADKGENN
jgi:hypothetical protein